MSLQSDAASMAFPLRFTWRIKVPYLAGWVL